MPAANTNRVHILFFLVKYVGPVKCYIFFIRGNWANMVNVNRSIFVAVAFRQQSMKTFFGQFMSKITSSIIRIKFS